MNMTFDEMKREIRFTKSAFREMKSPFRLMQSIFVIRKVKIV
jgi:hypothetical protein